MFYYEMPYVGIALDAFVEVIAVANIVLVEL